MPKIVIDVAGEPGGTPGVPGIFTFDKIAGSPPLVTMYLDDETGVTDWSWEVWSTPPGANPVVSGGGSNIATWTPEAYIPGTYLVKCVVNGAVVIKNAIAWKTRNLDVRLPAFDETTEYGVASGWDPAMRDLILKLDHGEGGQQKRAVIDYVDCTVAPPTTNHGDRYILDASGSVHADWDGAPQNAIVEFDSVSGEWQAEPPEEGWLVYVDLKNSDYRFIDDGAPQWEPVGSSSAVFFEHNIWVDADNGSDVPGIGDGSKGAPFETLAAAASSVLPPTSFPEFMQSVVFHVGPGTYSDAVTLPYRWNVTVVGYNATITEDVSWNYKLEYLFGQDKWTVPTVASFQGFTQGGLTLGNITSVNADNTQEFLPIRYMYIKDAILNGSVQNLESGGASAAYITGNLLLDINNCISQVSNGSVYIGGERETIDPADTANSILLTTTKCVLAHTVCGCVALYDCFHTGFMGGIDWRVNPVTGGGSYAGNVGGSPGAFCEFRQCVFNGTIRLGYDGITGGAPTSFKWDLFSYSEAFSSRVLDNITEAIQAQSYGIQVNEASMDSVLSGVTDVQDGFQKIDDRWEIYDGTTVFLNLTQGGGPGDAQLDLGTIDKGMGLLVHFSKTAGTSDNTTLQFYDGDPDGAGEKLYEILNHNLDIADIIDRNVWWFELPTPGELWVRVENNTSNSSSYSLRLRVKRD
jgi:hypothetical protein